jgi:hypothetical protein
LRGLIVAVEDRAEGPALLRDWQLLQRLNGLNVGRSSQGNATPGEHGTARLEAAEAFVRAEMPSLELPYQVPQVDAVAVLWPADG